ncbi:MAG: ABC transporter permease, partial [Cyanobacteria bacterium J06638_6]
LMGHLSQDLVAFGQLSETPAVQRLTHTLYLVLPDLERLNLRNQAAYGPELLPSGAELWGHGLYGLLYTVLLLMVASVIFSRRQF